MAITPVPDPFEVPAAPSRATDSPTAFRQKADALMGSLAGMVAWLRTVALSALNNALSAFEDATQTALDRIQTGLDRDAAALSAASAANAPGTMMTSATPVDIGTGLKTFPSQAGKTLVKGVPMEAASRANVQCRMAGFVDSYDSVTGILVLDVQAIRGSGTLSDWNIFSVPSPLFTEGYGLPQGVLSTAGPHLMAHGMSLNVDLAAGVNVQTQCPANPAQGTQFTLATQDRAAGAILRLDPNGQRFDRGAVGEVMEIKTAWTEITCIFEGAVWRLYPRAKR